MAVPNTHVVARQFTRCLQICDTQGVQQLVSDDFVHTGPDGLDRRGPKAAADHIARLWRAFPDLRVEVRSLHAAGDWAFCELVLVGTQLGPLDGQPPTRRRAVTRLCSVLECRDGLVVQERQYFDQLSTLRQLGALPGVALPTVTGEQRARTVTP